MTRKTREETCRTLEKLCYNTFWFNSLSLSEQVAIKMAMNALTTGKWIRLYPDDEFEQYECSVCGEEIGYKFNFCPNCGADMRE